MGTGGHRKKKEGGGNIYTIMEVRIAHKNEDINCNFKTIDA